MKKILTIGTVALFIILFFTPQIIATEEDDPEVPIDTQVFGIALINGTIEDPHSIYPFMNIINKLIGYKFMVIADFTDGTIKPRFKITGLREITLPNEDFTRAEIRGSFCRWTVEPIEGTNTYQVNGTIIHLVVNLY